MRRFFTEPDNIDLDNGTLTIIDDAAHISKVLRMECGDKIIVFDGTGSVSYTHLTLPTIA